jgi:hypothetical protein
MVYIVTTWLAVAPNPQDIRKVDFPSEKKRFHSLMEAKRYADSRIALLNIPGIAVEVSENKGRTKYRVERDPAGAVNEIPMV